MQELGGTQITDEKVNLIDIEEQVKNTLIDKVEADSETEKETEVLTP